MSATEPEDRRRIRTELCELRRLCGMTRQQVADSMDCSVSKIRHIEVGNVGVDQITLRALLDVYRVSDRALIAELVDLARTHRGRVRAAMRPRRQT
ncbi:helix-turn-helix domain-containing protein [Plantactinospora sp. GCM10030261]|uniref:helix-turn-helix domain-containing protein n=1 Tax=Plantactinospora sp. GCM10030261 TaxID=3273420 RepID=UPI0036104EFA